MGLSTDFIKGSNEILNYLTNKHKIVTTKNARITRYLWMNVKWRSFKEH